MNVLDRQGIAGAWYETCNTAILRENFRNRTRGNYSRCMNVNHLMDIDQVLENKVYSVIWMEGPRWEEKFWCLIFIF